jgi:hypothetical protein
MVGELRLWLSLIIETDEKEFEKMGRSIYRYPLLPNLTFKIRQGNALIQEIAGVLINLKTEMLNIPNPIRDKITELAERKSAFFSGLRSADLKELKEIEEFEQEIFKEIIQSKIDEVNKKHIDQFKSYFFRHNFLEIINKINPFLSSDFSKKNQSIQNEFNSEEELKLFHEMLYYIRKPKDLSDKLLRINTFGVSGNNDEQVNLKKEEQFVRYYSQGNFELNYDKDLQIIFNEKKPENAEFISERTLNDSIRIYKEKFALPEKNTFIVFPLQTAELITVLMNEDKKIENYMLTLMEDKTKPLIFSVSLGLSKGIFIFPLDFYKDIDMSNQFSKLIVSFLLPLEFVQNDKSENNKKSIVLYGTLSLNEFLFLNFSEHKRLKEMTNNDMKYFLNLTENFEIKNDKRKLYFTIIAEPKGLDDPERLFPNFDGLKDDDFDEEDDD